MLWLRSMIFALLIGFGVFCGVYLLKVDSTTAGSFGAAAALFVLFLHDVFEAVLNAIKRK